MNSWHPPNLDRRTTPIGLAVALALHAGVASALWAGLSVPVHQQAQPLEVRFVEIQPPQPEPVAPPPPAPKPPEPPPPVKKPPPPPKKPPPKKVERPPPPPAPVPAPPILAVAEPTPAPAEVMTVPPPMPAPPPEPVPVAAPAPAAPPAPVVAAPAPAPAPKLIPITPPNSQADYLRNPAPVYPTMSRRMGEEGRVLLRVHVERDGKPSQVVVRESSGFARLDESAVSAVRGWRFVPAKRGEETLAAWVLVPINFSLKNAY